MTRAFLPEPKIPDFELDSSNFKDSDIGPIPTEWEVVPLGQIAELSLGRTPERKEIEKYWTQCEIPWVSISDLNNGTVKETAERVSRRAFDEVFKQRIVPEGTLLLSFKLTIGKVGVLGMDAVHNEAIVSLGLEDSQIDRDFLFFLFQHIEYDDYLDSYVKGKTLSKRKLTVFPIPLPPLPEQRRIAHVLSTIQRAIAAQEDVIAAAKEFKRSLMHRLFTYGPGAGPAPTKETEIGEIPEHWEVVRLGQVCEKLTYGYTESATQDPVGPHFLRITDIQDGRVNWVSVPYCKCSDVTFEKYKLLPGDILFARIGATTGKSYLVSACPPAIFASYLIRARTKPEVDARYLSQYLNSEPYWQQINASKGGRLKKGISIPVLTDLLIPYPPANEQAAVANALTVVDMKIAAEEQRKAALQALFRSMLHQLMTGQVRVPASEEERS